ncbi:MAG: InlB B-repeat-containing protein [Methanosarcinales archaeon]|jgi:uncharacterized repeat protein (TIGR02543 family)|nr:InlB B-repeat-containing protein [Methanosarcinales archaeon]
MTAVHSLQSDSNLKDFIKYSFLIFTALIVLFSFAGSVNAAGSGFSGGEGTPSNPYIIGNAADLAAINDSLGSFFILGNDIDLSGISWTPLGSSQPFTGRLDGNGKTISNLSVDLTSSNVGLFAATSGAFIINLTIESAVVNGSSNVGAVAGSANDTFFSNVSVKNSYVTAANNNAGGIAGSALSLPIYNQTNKYLFVNCSISDTVISSNNATGGLAGQLISGDIKEVNVIDVTVTASGANAGGLVGILSQGQISKSSVLSTDLSSSGSKTIIQSQGGNAGGLVGFFDGTQQTGWWHFGDVSNSMFSGDVEATNAAGGLIGYGIAIDINNCGSAGNITSAGDYAGGLVGYFEGQFDSRLRVYGKINNSSSDSVVTAGTYAGGLAGFLNNSTILYSNSTGEVETTGTTGNEMTGGLIGFMTGDYDLTNNVYTLKVYVQNSYTESNVTAAGGYAGGFVGGFTGPDQTYVLIENSYSAGTVSVTGAAGPGSFGGNISNGQIKTSYSSSTDSSSAPIPVFVNQSSNSLLNETVWKNGTNENDMTSLSYFENTLNWSIDGRPNSSLVWYIEDGVSYPKLVSFYVQGAVILINSSNVDKIGTSEEVAGQPGVYYLLSANYRLTENIDFSGQSLTPIGNVSYPFTGTFDGGGYQLSNFTAVPGYTAGGNATGFFGYAYNAEFKNVNLSRVTIFNDADFDTTSLSAGALVGFMNNSIAGNCHVSDSTIQSGMYIGGLVGRGYDIEIYNSSAGNVTVHDTLSAGRVPPTLSIHYSMTANAGGLIGGTYFDCVIINSSVEGSDILVYENAGGLIGSMKRGTIQNSSSVSNTVTGNAYNVGGFMGYSSVAQIIDCVSEDNEVTLEAIYIITSIVNFAVQYAGGFAGCIEFGHIANSSSVNNAVTGIENVSLSLNASYLGGFTGFSSGLIENCTSDATVTGGSAEIGGFVGQHTNGIISNSSSKGTVTSAVDGDYVGGFAGFAYMVTFIDCTSDVDVSGNDLVGGLVGYLSSSGVENCSVSGNVVGNDDVGGLIGYALSSAAQPFNITDSSFTGNVTATGDAAGGVIGYGSSANKIIISNMSMAGSVTSEGNYTGGMIGYIPVASRTDILNSVVAGNVMSNGSYTGGMIGYTPAVTNILNSVVAGNVTSNGSYTGGFAGYAMNTDISDSYVTGNVNGVAFVGGFAGFANNTTSISNSFMAGNTIGSGNQVGGFMGQAGSGATVSNSYVTGDVSGVDLVGGLVGWNNYGIIQNSMALNEFVNGTGNRVNSDFGYMTGTGSSNLFVWNNISNGTTGTITNLTAVTVVTSEDVWRSYPTSPLQTINVWSTFDAANWTLNSYGKFMMPVQTWNIQIWNENPLLEYAYVIADATHLIPKYMIIYDGNGYTAGTVPVDQTVYQWDGVVERATILGPGNMAKTGYTFTGWKTDGITPEESYQPEQIRPMISSVVLFAQWELTGTTPGGGGNGTGNATVNDSNNTPGTEGPGDGNGSGPSPPAPPGPGPEEALIVVLFFMIGVAVFIYRRNVEAKKEK